MLKSKGFVMGVCLTIVQLLHIGLMCAEDVSWLSDWRPRYLQSDDAILSLTGWNELREIGQSTTSVKPNLHYFSLFRIS